MSRSTGKLEHFRAAELFAGVGGFRLGLEAGGWEVVWSNQWEPATRKQHASECYIANFGSKNHICDNITEVLNRVESGSESIPQHEMVVGGFPCQDYSVAKPLNQADGITGRKGILWWEIYRFLKVTNPPLLLLENVDRLLKSTAKQRGRDFAIMLTCLSNLGYAVEWRVINAADYGFPQRRRRVFIVGVHQGLIRESWSPLDRMMKDGILARALPAKPNAYLLEDDRNGVVDACRRLPQDPFEVSSEFGKGLKRSPFQNSGVMIEHKVWTRQLLPDFQVDYSDGAPRMLGDVVGRSRAVPGDFYLNSGNMDKWRYLKGAKNERRIHKASGKSYFYTEGALPFPDPLNRPSRTVLTGEGGSSPSRFKHVVEEVDGRLRRLIPDELEELNGFPRGWTSSVKSDVKRAFLMGNALVVGLVERIAKEIRFETS